jgi:hypothetical protein
MSQFDLETIESALKEQDREFHEACERLRGLGDVQFMIPRSFFDDVERAAACHAAPVASAQLVNCVRA